MWAGGDDDQICGLLSPYKVEIARCHQERMSRVLQGLKEGDMARCTFLASLTCCGKLLLCVPLACVTYILHLCRAWPARGISMLLTCVSA